MIRTEIDREEDSWVFKFAWPGTEQKTAITLDSAEVKALYIRLWYRLGAVPPEAMEAEKYAQRAKEWFLAWAPKHDGTDYKDEAETLFEFVKRSES